MFPVVHLTTREKLDLILRDHVTAETLFEQGSGYNAEFPTFPSHSGRYVRSS